MRFFKIFIYGLILGSSLLTLDARAAIEAKAIEDLRYPMHISVPAESQQNGDMIITLSQKKDTKEVSKQLRKAVEKGFHVLAVDIELRDGEQPTHVDQWIENLKKEMTLRYRVKNFYLLGYDERAHYVSYYGLQHPKDFTAYAAIGGSWSGPFEKIVKPSDKAKKQAPFFIALPKEDKTLTAAQNYATDLSAKGYDVRFVVLDQVGEESSSSFLNDLTSWFKEQNQKKETADKKPRTFKEKFSKAKDEFFALN